MQESKPAAAPLVQTMADVEQRLESIESKLPTASASTWRQYLPKVTPYVIIAGTIAFALLKQPSIAPIDPIVDPNSPISLVVSSPVNRVGVPFLVSYETPSPATWIDPELDGMSLHGGPEFKVGKVYKGNAQVTFIKPGAYSFCLGIVQKGQIVYAVGHAETDVLPGPIPTPTPAPVPDISALQQQLQAAYNADLDPNKAAHVKAFADLLANLVPQAQASGKIKTARDFTTLAHSSTEIAVGPVATAIPKVRQAVASYLQSTLPRDPTTAFDSAYVANAIVQHNLVATALKGIK